MFGSRMSASEGMRLLERARRLRQRGWLRMAIRAYTRLILSCRDIGMPGTLYFERGEVHQARGRLLEAMADYSAAISLNPHPSFYVRRVNVAAALGFSEDVTVDMAVLLTIAPDDPTVRGLAQHFGLMDDQEANDTVLRARDAKAAGNLDEALRLFSEVIARRPDIGQPGVIYSERGEVHQALGRHDEAMADYSKAIEINPLRDLYIRRVNLAAATGRFDVADRDLAAMKERFPGDALVSQLAAAVDKARPR
ncbi:MAG: tetratricopeptide repeat protein [Acidimicrobiia bacterium]|nr:tetratricopeptide repeat protein [Acidimicrobiia bacterium]